MLTIVTRKYVKNKIETGGIVLNTAFMSELQASGTGAKFKFFNKGEDRRGGEDYYIVEESVATILTDLNTAFVDEGITLDIYPDNDTNNATVETVFNVAEIVRTYPNTVSDRTKCWVELNEKGSNLRKYLVAHYYINLYDLAKSGTTTTTTTT